MTYNDKRITSSVANRPLLAQVATRADDPARHRAPLVEGAAAAVEQPRWPLYLGKREHPPP
ncbi:hypothetical protein BN12_160017 [Nostocoides japonicum T1-X7]|uniref:Uncharacterized protein n=1 Tax=Nostocoides japonicum T1-X7 TaxID=1194083 RepID=A0A077LW44_9MICO|nr:hypothetical protein BN12_160017 [Tetrasphaera japonica T1-X7]